jgi:uncharacterized protein YijF (DUF1287 family)
MHPPFRIRVLFQLLLNRTTCPIVQPLHTHHRQQAEESKNHRKPAKHVDYSLKTDSMSTLTYIHIMKLYLPISVSASMPKILLLLILITSALAEPGTKIVEAAREQVGVTTVYDPAYVSLKYPGGDLPLKSGVCTDVIIRALRTALDQDLQKLVHEDMHNNFSKYPKIWGLSRTDRSIDHRRVPNLKTYFKRRGFTKPVTKNAADYQPGDLVTCTVPPNLPHIMIVSDKKSADGTPLVIHNIGRGAREEDSLFTYPLTGHYRWSK